MTAILLKDGAIVHKLPSGSMQRWKATAGMLEVVTMCIYHNQYTRQIHEMTNNPFGGDVSRLQFCPRRLSRRTVWLRTFPTQ